MSIFLYYFMTKKKWFLYFISYEGKNKLSYGKMLGKLIFQDGLISRKVKKSFKVTWYLDILRLLLKFCLTYNY